MLDIHLRDIAPDVVAAWEDSFSGLTSVKISCGEHASSEIQAAFSRGKHLLVPSLGAL